MSSPLAAPSFDSIKKAALPLSSEDHIHVAGEITDKFRTKLLIDKSVVREQSCGMCFLAISESKYFIILK